jgi:hypothetical protein
MAASFPTATEVKAKADKEYQDKIQARQEARQEEERRRKEGEEQRLKTEQEEAAAVKEDSSEQGEAQVSEGLENK